MAKTKTASGSDPHPADKTAPAEAEAGTYNVAKDAPPDAPAAAETPPDAAETPPESDFEKAKREAKENLEQYLRAVADLENYRRRVEKDMANSVQSVLGNFCLSVCEVRDCMESALAATEDGAEKMHEGLKLTLRKMESAMERQGILTVCPDAGVVFDPQLHEAVTTQENSDLSPNSIVEVIRVGYTINGRVLRAASVIVSKAPNKKEN